MARHGHPGARIPPGAGTGGVTGAADGSGGAKGRHRPKSCTLEAMKMEQNVKRSADGVVEVVLARRRRVGDTVLFGKVLVELE